jgi:hypothetical protein
MSLDYGRMFGMKVIFSAELQDNDIYDKLVADGFIWIKQKYNSHFERILRFPTVGRWLEISRMPQVKSVPIQSLKGQKLINTLCYFSA